MRGGSRSCLWPCSGPDLGHGLPHPPCHRQAPAPHHACPGAPATGQRFLQGAPNPRGNRGPRRLEGREPGSWKGPQGSVSSPPDPGRARGQGATAQGVSALKELPVPWGRHRCRGPSWGAQDRPHPHCSFLSSVTSLCFSRRPRRCPANPGRTHASCGLTGGHSVQPN